MSSSLSFDWSQIALIGIIIALLLFTASRPKCSSLPPGPPQLPLIGNAFDIPRKNLGVEFRRISERHGAYIEFALTRILHTDPTSGDIVYFNALGRNVIVLGSYDTARELLQKRSANYSGNNADFGRRNFIRE